MAVAATGWPACLSGEAGDTARDIAEGTMGNKIAIMGVGAVGGYAGAHMAQAGEDAAVLKTLAAAIVSEPGLVVVFAGQGRPAPVVVARSADVNIDAGAWIKRATTEFGGRGGGRPEQAQGGIDATADQVIDFARRTLL